MGADAAGARARPRDRRDPPGPPASRSGSPEVGIVAGAPDQVSTKYGNNCRTCTGLAPGVTGMGRVIPCRRITTS